MHGECNQLALQKLGLLHRNSIMKYYYSTYIESNYYRNIHSDEPLLYMHGENVLIAANSSEEAIKKAESWVLSKRREVMDIREPFAIPRNEFFDGWQERKKGWRWYEVNAAGIREKGKLKVVYGYIFAPNKKYVKQKLKEMGTPSIIIISRADWNSFIK
jgi:hypothetical protein